MHSLFFHYLFYSFVVGIPLALLRPAPHNIIVFLVINYFASLIVNSLAVFGLCSLELILFEIKDLPIFSSNLSIVILNVY